MRTLWPGTTVAVLPMAQNVTIEVILQAVLGVHDADTRKRFRRLIDQPPIALFICCSG